MRPAPLDIVRQGDLGGKKIAMTVNVLSLDKIMTLLTDVYSDPAAAVIREYSTNAWDSHIQVGNTAPIEISTPNGLSPFFRVRDYGMGMSYEDLENIYSQYATTTKDKSDSYNGMLGIGSKSGLTFTQQFTLISVHNGLKISVSISRTENGTGELEVVDTRATDEPNGVEIVIPVTDTNGFNEKVKHFFKFWKPGTVLVDQSQPEFIGDSEDASWIDDDIIVMKNGRSQDYIVMGNVAYPTDKLQFSEFHRRTYGVVAFVEMGAIQFPPSRESLHYTTRTLAVVEKVRARVEAQIAKQAQEEINACANYEYGETLYLNEWKNILPNHIFNYRGLDFKYYWEMRGDIYSLLQKKGAVDVKFNFTRNDLLSASALIVVGFKAGKVTPATRTKTKLYLQTLENPASIRRVIYLEEHPDKERILSLKTVEWETIKAFKIVRIPKDKKPIKFTALDIHGEFGEVDELDDEKETLYSPAELWKQVDWYAIRELTKTHNVVKLYVRDKERFDQVYPDAQYLKNYLKTELAAKNAALTDMDKISLSGNDYYEKHMARTLNPDEIDDPRLSEYIRNYKNSTTTDTLKEYQQTVIWARASKVPTPVFSEKTSPMEDYPLAKHATSHPKHATVYINAIYKMKNGATP